MATKNKLWTPSHGDIERAEQAYLRYATGVVMLHDPEHAISLALLDRPPKDPHAQRFMEKLPEQRDPEVLVAGAERLMWRGLREVVRNLNPPDVRRRLIDTSSRYIPTRPILESLVDVVTNPDIDSDITDELFTLDTSLPDPEVAPMPLLDERIYRCVALSSPLRVRTVELLGDFAVDPELEDIVTEGRRISNGRINGERARMFVAPVEEDLSPKIS